MSDNEDVAKQIDSLKRSKLSIAEVLKQVDLVKDAFVCSARIETRQATQQTEINSLKALAAELVPRPSSSPEWMSSRSELTKYFTRSSRSSRVTSRANSI